MGKLLEAFYKCGDAQFIEFVEQRLRLTEHERELISARVDKDLTQLQVAELLNLSVNGFQKQWNALAERFMSIPWVYSYAKRLVSD